MLHCRCGYTCGVQVAFDRHIKKLEELGAAPGEHAPCDFTCDEDPDDPKPAGMKAPMRHSIGTADSGLMGHSKSVPCIDKTKKPKPPVCIQNPDDEDPGLPQLERAASSPQRVEVLLSPKTPSSPLLPVLGRLPQINQSRESLAATPTDKASPGGHIRLLLIRHAQSANKDRISGQRASSDPDLSDMGFEQAESLGKRLLKEYGGAHAGQVMIVASPMRRCLFTILPAVKLLNLVDGRVLVHGSCFEFGCAGKRYVSSTAKEIKKEFPYFEPVGFTSSGNWDYRGDNPKEDTADCRARALRIQEWLQEQATVLLAGTNGGVPTLILCTHQTMNDLLCQLLVDGSAKKWEYGDIKHKLNNTAMTELFFQPSGQATFGAKNDDKHVPSMLGRRRATTMCF